MGTIGVSKDEIVQDALASLVDDLPNNAFTFIDDVAEILKSAMMDITPIGETSQLHDLTTILYLGDLVRYIYSEAPYFDDVVDGHYVFGPVFSDKQRRWWFWYLRTELGGVYTPKVGSGNRMEGNDYPLVAIDNADPDIEQRASDFLDLITSGD